jgi:hypothetical protein
VDNAEAQRTAVPPTISDADAAALSGRRAELASKSAELEQLNEEVADVETARSKPVSEGFLADLLSDVNGVTIHRLQIVLWTVTLGVIFIRSVWSNLQMPEFDEVVLGLMGISGVTYLGFKIPERQHDPEPQPPVPTVGGGGNGGGNGATPGQAPQNKPQGQGGQPGASAPPTISAIDPPEGGTAGGTEVSITGDNFRPDAKVTFGGVEATVTSVEAQLIKVGTPPHDAGKVDVVVKNTDGQSQTSVGGFEYKDDDDEQPPPPHPDGSEEEEKEDESGG